MGPTEVVEYTKEKLEEISADTMRRAKENLQRDGHLLEIAMLLGGRESILLGLDHKDDESKKRVYAEFQTLLREKRPEVLVRVMDTWIKVLNKSEIRAPGPVSDMPGRQEAISVIVTRKEGVGHHRTAVYTRQGEYLVFEKDMTNFFERGDILSSVKF